MLYPHYTEIFQTSIFKVDFGHTTGTTSAAQLLGARSCTRGESGGSKNAPQWADAFVQRSKDTESQIDA